MTYILGWKDQNGNAFLSADTVATSQSRLGGIPVTTSFGERHVNTATRQVVESLLKIVNLRSIAVAIAGRYETGIEIIDQVDGLLRAGTNPRDAFRTAINSHCPMTREASVTAIAVIPEEPAAAVVAFNVHGQEEFRELKGSGGHVHVGSIGLTKKALVFATIRAIAPSISALPPVGSLACTLALQQSLGVRDYLLEEHGAGGSVCGLYSTPHEIAWQPDILYLPFTSATSPPTHLGAVWSAIRDDALVIKSTFSDATSAFYTSVGGLDPVAWRAKWQEDLMNDILLMRSDYVMLLDADWPNVVVLQMQGRRESSYLIFGQPRAVVGSPKRMEIRLSFSSHVYGLMATPRPRDIEEEQQGGVPVRFTHLTYKPLDPADRPKS